MTNSMEVTSSNWRMSKSAIPSIEMANAIRSLSKVVGAFETDTKTVSYSHNNLSYNNHKVKGIYIDPKYATKSTPIEDADFDVLVGLSVHESMHTVADSHLIDIDYSDLARGVITSKSIAAIGEEIYCDNLSRRLSPVAFKYVRKARLAYANNVPTDWTKPLDAWTSVSVYGELPTEETPVRTLRALKILSTMSLNLSTKNHTVNQRRRLYSDAAQDLASIALELEAERKLRLDNVGAKEGEDWSSLDEEKVGAGGKSDEGKDGESNDNDDKPSSGGMADNVPDDKDSQPGIQPSEPSVSNSSEAGNGNMEAEENNSPDKILEAQREARLKEERDILERLDNRTTSLSHQLSMESGETISEDLAKQIQEAIDLDSQDILDSLLDIGMPSADARGRGIHSVIWERPKPNPDPTFDEALYRQLLWISLLRNAASKETYRHQENGRLDGRHLYRAKIDQRPFKRTRRLPLAKTKLVLLLDASSSMGPMGQYLKNPVYNAAAAVLRAVPDAIVLSYASEMDGIRGEVKILNHSTHGAKMDVIKPGGNTPSGIGILSAAMKYPDSMIVHFTDGESNLGITPESAWEIIEKKFPKVKLIDIHYTGTGWRKSSDIEGIKPTNRVQVVKIQNMTEFGKTLRDAIKPWYQGLL